MQTRVCVGDHEIDLTVKEFDAFRLLIMNLRGLLGNADDEIKDCPGDY